MNVKTVAVNYERKINLGDFNSATVGCTLWADVREEDDLDACMGALWAMAKTNVKAQAQPLVANHKAQVKELFLGLPLDEPKDVAPAREGDIDLDLDPRDGLPFGDK